MRYLIKRQDGIKKEVLGWVNAKDKSEAISRASETWGCYGNQFFEVLTYNEASFEDVCSIPVTNPLS